LERAKATRFGAAVGPPSIADTTICERAARGASSRSPLAVVAAARSRVSASSADAPDFPHAAAATSVAATAKNPIRVVEFVIERSYACVSTTP
jgi:hypothetical protein